MPLSQRFLPLASRRTRLLGSISHCTRGRTLDDLSAERRGILTGANSSELLRHQPLTYGRGRVSVLLVGSSPSGFVLILIHVLQSDRRSHRGRAWRWG